MIRRFNVERKAGWEWSA